MPAWALPLAQAVDASRGVLPLWAEFGLAGAVVAAIVAEWLVGGRTYRRESERADRLEAELRRVNAKVIEDVVPALERAALIVETARVDRRGERRNDREIPTLDDGR